MVTIIDNSCDYGIDSKSKIECDKNDLRIEGVKYNLYYLIGLSK